jgi:hypothetical protein
MKTFAFTKAAPAAALLAAASLGTAAPFLSAKAAATTRMAQAGYFRSAAPETFDGLRWAGLTIGQTTNDDLKKQFRTETGAFRREAFRFARQPDSNDDPRVEAILDGSRGVSRVIGFLLRYDEGDGPDPARLAERLNEKPARFYPEGDRYDEWHIKAFPDHGVALVVVGGDEDEDDRRGPVHVLYLLLCRPESLADLVSRWQRRPSPVVDARTRLREKPPVLEIGAVDVSLSLKHVSLTRTRDVEDDLERSIEDDLSRYARRRDEALVFRRSGKGTFRVSLSAEFNSPRRTTSVNATASIEGETAYGRVSASGYGSDKIEERGLADKENPVWRSGRNFERAFDEAVRDALREAEDKIRKVRPPDPETARRDSWLAFVQPIR